MNKAKVRALLVRGDWESLRELAAAERRVLSLLLSLTYDPDETIAWQAVEGLGVAGAVVADQDPEFVRGILRRLLWSLNDESGGIGWKSPQALGAMAAARLDRFPEFVPLIISLFEIEEAMFRPGILWALGRIAEQDPAAIQQACPWVLQLLRDPDPQTRGLAAWCAGRAALEAARPLLRPMTDDPAEVHLFERGHLHTRTVGTLAREALAALAA